MKLGPTGDFPRGKLNASDEGGINVGIAWDPKDKVVVIHFGNTRIKWLALPPAEAVRFAEAILEKATEGIPKS